MTKTGAREYLRRSISLVLLTLGLIGFAYWDRGTASTLIVTAVLFYHFLPKVLPPPKALVYERMPAVVVPDLLGFALTAFFIALPFWAHATDDDMYENFLLVHPAAVLTWPMALITIFILVVAANYASYWVVIETNGLTVSSAKKEKFLAFEQMVEISPFRRGLPKWTKLLTPLLVLSGKYTVAGAVLLARDANGMSIKLQDETSVNIASEAFEKPFKEILKVTDAHAVAIDPVFLSRIRQ